MQVNLNDEREAIARIIDPESWAFFDRCIAHLGAAGMPALSLAKADAILALRTKEPSRG